MKGRTLGNVLSRPKLGERNVLDNGGVVYEQRCGDCDKVVGRETDRRASAVKPVLATTCP